MGEHRRFRAARGRGGSWPIRRARDVVEGVAASLVDVTNPMVFVRAQDLGLSGTERAEALDADLALAARLEAIRVAAAGMMGIPFTALDGTAYATEQADLVARVISMGNCHRAFALTAAMSLAVAARIEGTVRRPLGGTGDGLSNGSTGDGRLGEGAMSEHDMTEYAATMASFRLEVPARFRSSATLGL